MAVLTERRFKDVAILTKGVSSACATWWYLLKRVGTTWRYLLKRIPIDFFGDVVLAVRVLEGQVELVILLQHVEALLVASGTLHVATGAVDIDCDVFLKFRRVLLPPVASVAVRHEPRHHFCFTGHVIVRRDGKWCRLEGYVLLVGRDDGGVSTVGGRPVDTVLVGGSADGGLKVRADENLST